jgi:hypothetical protein
MKTPLSSACRGTRLCRLSGRLARPLAITQGTGAFPWAGVTDREPGGVTQV